VTVRLRLASGAVAPLADTVAPGATWILPTSQQTRLPSGAAYAAVVDASGGPGVVVSRAVGDFGSPFAPQAGLAVGVDGLTSATPTNEWIVPPPGTSSNPATSGAAPRALAMVNVGGSPQAFSAYAVDADGRRHVLASGTLAPGAFEAVSGSVLSGIGFDPIVVRGAGPLAVSEDLMPSARVGVVTMPGIPLAATIGV
jgi:hypothetical protein